MSEAIGTVSASKHGVVQNSSISAIMPTSLFEALTEHFSYRTSFTTQLVECSVVYCTMWQ